MAANELWVPPSAAIQTNEFKKAAPPKMGNAFGSWAGRDTSYLTLPGGGVLQFDLSRLTLSDFRSMKDHYQVNASLSILSFMIHQLDWSIECDDAKIASAAEENMRLVWTRLIRGLSQAFWAGYSPLVIDWDNDLQNKRIVASKFKDLVPEECFVNWKQVEGYAPPNHARPKFNEYDGIKHAGSSFPIPAESTLWYPLLMENGDYYGRKLLRPAFPSWFFSILLHLFANRYFERFGEPVPVGRAPFDDEVMLNNQMVSGRDAMEVMLNQLRSRAVVVLPSERDPQSAGSSGKSDYMYDIEYLESQMRGADFERYMTRLDEEMSIGLFTPILLLRTADVGSYNLGVGHMQMYMWMLNALAGDIKEYIDRYFLGRFVDFNFGPNAARAYWKPRPLGKDAETMRTIVASLISDNRAKPDLDELGSAIGLSLSEVRELTEPDEPQGGGEGAPPKDGDMDNTDREGTTRRRVAVTATMKEIENRITGQVEKAMREGTFGNNFKPSMGFRGRFKESLRATGMSTTQAQEATDRVYSRMDYWVRDVVALGPEEFSSPGEFQSLFSNMLAYEVESIVPGI